MTTYKVTGLTAFLGHQPGEEFDADLDENVERRAKERGSIRVVKRNSNDKVKEEVDDE